MTMAPTGSLSPVLPTLTTRRRWVALLVLCAGLLMIILDGTVVTVALPSIQQDLGFSATELSVVVSAYLVPFGGVLLLAGRIGDLTGRRRVFLLGVAGFTIASGRLVLGLLFAALFLGIYLPVMRVEASHVAELFGSEYETYRRAVPLFFPRLTPFRQNESATNRFDGSLYLRYREYRAALGLVAAWGLLLIKTYYF